MFLCHLTCLLYDVYVTNHGDDNTPCFTGLKVSDILIKLENSAQTKPQGFTDLRMKANPGKYSDKPANNKEQSFQNKIDKKQLLI